MTIFGVEHSTQRKDVIEKIKNTRVKHTIERYTEELKPYNIDLLEYTNVFKIHCNICNTDSIVNVNTLKTRLHRNRITPCMTCRRINYSVSNKEELLLNFIIEHTNIKVLHNDRTILNGKELDIYLPDKKLAFEFDGTYWHADKRFYKADDIVGRKGRYCC